MSVSRAVPGNCRGGCAVKVRKAFLQTASVMPPSHPIDSWGRLPLQIEVAGPEEFRRYVVQQRGDGCTTRRGAIHGRILRPGNAKPARRGGST